MAVEHRSNSNFNRQMSFNEYYQWSMDSIDTNWNDIAIKQLYEINTASFKNVIQDHSWYIALPDILTSIARDYDQRDSKILLPQGGTVNLGVKPFASVVNKSFRHNVIKNGRFTNPPEEGWCNRHTLYTVLNDIIRGLIVCRYADGPAIIAKAIHHAAKTNGLESRFYPMNNDAGYYAYHVYVYIPVPIAYGNGVTQINLSIEIHVTTQLQEVLRDLTHSVYEETRTTGVSGKDWKWDFGAAKFKSSYLGHTLHLIEAMIVELKREMKDSSEHTDAK